VILVRKEFINAYTIKLFVEISLKCNCEIMREEKERESEINYPRTKGKRNSVSIDMYNLFIHYISIYLSL